MQKRKKTRKERAADQMNNVKRIPKKTTPIKYHIISIGFILMIIIAFYLASYTIIDSWIIIKYALILGFIILLIWGIFESIFWEDLQWVCLQYALTSAIGGMIVIYANSFSLNPNYEDLSLKLENKRFSQNRRSGKQSPLATITYNGNSANIQFKYHEKTQFQSADSIRLKVRKGNLGYGIMKDHKFLNRTKYNR